MQVDDAFCTEIFLSNLLAFAPTNDDDLNTMEKYLKKTDEECEELDLPEQLIIHVSHITWHLGSGTYLVTPFFIF